MIRSVCATLLSFAIVSSAMGSPIKVDGVTTDWGVVIADNNASTYVFNSGIGLVDYFEEDQDDHAGDGGAVGPNQGGQKYDSELLAIAMKNGMVFGLIVTGQRPDNGFSKFGPGDVRFATTGGVYGLEVGGGAGGGGFHPAITEGAAGSTYTLDGNGHTTAHNVAAAGQTAGSVWKNATWILDPIAPPVETQYQLNGGSSMVGLADYFYSMDSITSQHAIIEFAIPKSYFEGNHITGISWHPSCGNDEMFVIPEPGVMGLIVVGVVCLLRRRGA